jgi:hypothetical protein
MDAAISDLGSVVIDGVPVEDLESYRVESPLFEFGPLPANSLFEHLFGIASLDPTPEGATSMSVIDGVWLLLTPPSVGEHEIHIRAPGRGIDDRFQVTVTPPLGDFDLDGSLTAMDIDHLSAEIRVGGTDVHFDLNGDSRVDTADRTVWVHDLRKTYFGDANLDGQFSRTDMVAVLQAGQYEDMISGNSGWTSGDWDGDGDFTTRDLVAALQDGGYEKGPRAGVAVVPEPPGSMVLLLGLMTFLAHTRRGWFIARRPKSTHGSADEFSLIRFA